MQLRPCQQLMSSAARLVSIYMIFCGAEGEDAESIQLYSMKGASRAIFP